MCGNLEERRLASTSARDGRRGNNRSVAVRNKTSAQPPGVREQGKKKKDQNGFRPNRDGRYGSKPSVGNPYKITQSGWREDEDEEKGYDDVERKKASRIPSVLAPSPDMLI